MTFFVRSAESKNGGRDLPNAAADGARIAAAARKAIEERTLMDWDPAQDRDDFARDSLIDGGSLAAGDGWCDDYAPDGEVGGICKLCGLKIGSW